MRSSWEAPPFRAERLLKSIVFIAVASYCGLAVVLWALQEKLLFHPMPLLGRPTPPAGWTLEAVRLAASDGTKLAGVLVKPPGPPAPLLIYYGGNADEATAWAREAAEYGPRALLLMNYRGYGESEGSPSEAALVADALEIVDAVARRTDIDGARIGLIGASLGSGVAVQVAVKRPAVKAVVLATPYDSIVAVASALYWYMPIKYLVRHPFDSAARAQQARMPALIVTGSADRTIPPSHAKRLASLWGGSVEEVSIAGADHNDVVGPSYFGPVRGFLDRHL
jgi:uncharacterized protein